MPPKAKPTPSKEAAPEPAAEDAAEVEPQDFGVKASAYAGYVSETLQPLLLELLTKLEETVEFVEGTVRRPLSPKAWLSTYLHIDSYTRENALMRDEIEALKAELQPLKEEAARRDALKPKPAEEEEEDAE